MQEKAGKIEQKLTKIEDDQNEETKFASHNFSLVPFDSTAVSWNPSSALMKKNYSNENYQLLPVISTLKTDPEGIISLSDIDDEEID